MTLSTGLMRNLPIEGGMFNFLFYFIFYQRLYGTLGSGVIGSGWKDQQKENEADE